MERITSADNQRVRRLAALGTQAKARRQSQSFVIEGSRLILDAPEAYLREIYLSESFLAKLAKEAAGEAEEGRQEQGSGTRQQAATIRQQAAERLLERLASHSPAVLMDSVFRKAANTQTPQGILAVAETPHWDFADLLDGGMNASRPGRAMEAGQAPLLLVLEDIQDPGNLGTMFRTAEAAGATGIVLTRGCVDLFNPKTVRATMSSIFRVPFLVTEDLRAVLVRLHAEQIQTYAADLQGSVPYDTCSYRGGSAFLIGNEGSGLRQATAAAAGRRIRIPMEGRIESLNAAMSAGILLYEAHRQRERAG